MRAKNELFGIFLHDWINYKYDLLQRSACVDCETIYVVTADEWELMRFDFYANLHYLG